MSLLLWCLWRLYTHLKLIPTMQADILYIPMGASTQWWAVCSPPEGRTDGLWAEAVQQPALLQRTSQTTRTPTCAYAHVASHIHPETHTHTSAQTHAHMPGNTYTHVHTHTYTYTLTGTQSLNSIKRGTSPQMYPLEISEPTLLPMSWFQIMRPHQDPLLSNFN